MSQHINPPQCPECGYIHPDWPALAFLAPVNYHCLSEAEKADMGYLSADFCEIQYEDQCDRFIRVTLTQRVNDCCEDLEYGLWVSLSEQSYEDYRANFDNENHLTGYFGWLCSNIPEYDNTMSIPCNVMTRTGHQRPEIIPHQSFDHPFVEDYYNGISKAEADRRVRNMLQSLSEV